MADDGGARLREFAAELGRIRARALPEVDAIVKRGADNIKNEMVADAEGSRHFKRVAPSISYDSHYRMGQVAYEIGPDKDRAPGGALANIAYFGGANGGGGSLDIDKPFDAEQPRMMAALDAFLAGLA